MDRKCENCTHDEVCSFRNSVSAEECVFFSDDAEAKADYNNENEDTNFFCHIISEICNYAVKHGMKPDETIKEIAKDMLAMLKISTFNAWTISEQAESEESNERT